MYLESKNSTHTAPQVLDIHDQPPATKEDTNVRIEIYSRNSAASRYMRRRGNLGEIGWASEDTGLDTSNNMIGGRSSAEGREMHANIASESRAGDGFPMKLIIHWYVTES
jgi:hypothetical protein